MRSVLFIAACLVLAGCAGAPAASPAARAVLVTGSATVTTILEDFDRGPPELAMSRHVDTWGDRIRDTSGTVDIVDAGKGGAGKAARYFFTASFDMPYSPSEWKDSGLSFVGAVELPAPAAGTQGVALRIRPEGFTLMELFLVQETAGGTVTAQVPLFANDGSWKDLHIPFSAFLPTDPGPGVDFSRPMRLVILVPWQENWNAWHFRTGTKTDAAFALDSIGFWRATARDDRGSLERFDDERDRMPFTVDLYGSSAWTDYSRTDTGEAKLNEGVSSQTLLLDRQPGGPEGVALALSGRLELTPAIAEFHKAGQTLTLYLKAPLGVPVAGFHAISFLVRSDTAQAGTFEIQDPVNEKYYAAGFSLIGAWTRVRIPFDTLKAGADTLADARTVSDGTQVQISFELPPAAVERAASSGVLEFTVALDDLKLE